MPETIFLESYPGDKIAWVHLEDPKMKHCRPIQVSDELHQYLTDNPIEPDSPLSELLQIAIKHGYALGG